MPHWFPPPHFPFHPAAVSGFFHHLLPEIENDLGEQRKWGSWCAADFGRGYRLDEQQTRQLFPVLFKLMHSCQPCRLPGFGSRLCSVSWSNCTQKWEKFARFLDSDPNESEAQSARCGCLSVMNYRFGCRFLLSSHTESKLKCCFIKVKLLHDTPNKMFPKTLDLFHVSLCARPSKTKHTHKQTYWHV